MRTTRFFMVLTAGYLAPFSLTAQSVNVRIPQPPIHLAVPFPVELHPPSGFPMDLRDADRDLPVEAQETIQKSFSMAGVEHRSLEIDNVWGSIEVVGTGSDQARLTLSKSIRAESKDKLEQARKEVTRDINGNFLVRNVNGDVEMDGISGSGTARTVNGPVKVSFRRNPREASDFQTVNGAVELRFARDLAADFRFKTFNGSIYSDFPVAALPVRPMQEEHHGAKVVYRADRYTGVRIGTGGPEIKVQNLNGDIRILENHE